MLVPNMVQAKLQKNHHPTSQYKPNLCIFETCVYLSVFHQISHFCWIPLLYPQGRGVSRVQLSMSENVEELRVADWLSTEFPYHHYRMQTALCSIHLWHQCYDNSTQEQREWILDSQVIRKVQNGARCYPAKKLLFGRLEFKGSSSKHITSILTHWH